MAEGGSTEKRGHIRPPPDGLLQTPSRQDWAEVLTHPGFPAINPDVYTYSCRTTLKPQDAGLIYTCSYIHR